MNTPIIDTHAHVGDEQNVFKGEPFRTPEVLLALMDENNVQTTVIIPYLGYTNNRYLADQVSRHPTRFVGVAYVDWRREDACEELTRLSKTGCFRGIRLEAHARSPGRDPWQIWKTAHSLGLRVSVQGGRSPAFWAEGFGEVLKEMPELAARIEHLARPQVDRGPNDPAFQGVLRLSNFPNVVMNIDDLWGVSKIGFPYDDVWPFVEASISSFGPERLMWGSDVPYLFEVQQYKDSYGEIIDKLADKSQDVRDSIFFKSASKFWSIPQIK